MVPVELETFPGLLRQAVQEGDDFLVSPGLTSPVPWCQPSCSLKLWVHQAPKREDAADPMSAESTSVMQGAPGIAFAAPVRHGRRALQECTDEDHG